MAVPSETLLRYACGEMPAAEAEALRTRLAADPALRAALADIERVQAHVSALPRAGFSPGFAARLERRLEPEPRVATEVVLAEALNRLFPRVAFAAVLVVTTLTVVAGTDRRWEADSVVDAALGIPAPRFSSLSADAHALVRLHAATPR